MNFPPLHLRWTGKLSAASHVKPLGIFCLFVSCGCGHCYTLHYWAHGMEEKSTVLMKAGLMELIAAAAAVVVAALIQAPHTRIYLYYT